MSLSHSPDLSIDSNPPGPVDPTVGKLRPLGHRNLQITGGYWADFQGLNGGTIITHAETWMEHVGWIGNFDAAVQGRLPAARHGREFSDSDVYKLLEAMAWEIGRTGNAALETRFNALIERIAPVQEDDGYLNTMYGRPGQQPRYSNLEWGHELYCYGHLIQAAVARGRTHGADELVEIAHRAADHVCDVFGPDRKEAVCGHPEIETALVELARFTGNSKYLDQARVFIDRRGRGLLKDIEMGQDYFQDEEPVRTAQTLRGHAVRALYLCSGAVDVAVETGDDELLHAVEAQLHATLARRTYITGGMGARHEGESFGQDFELPADRSYSETCAGVAAVMLAQRLLLATGDSRLADTIERVLYNVVSASPAADGKAFFYTNTLHQRVPGTPASTDVMSPRAASMLRAPWFAVSCCPTNVARTIASLDSYIATADDQGIQLQQFASADVRADLPGGRSAAFHVQTQYPDDGRVLITLTETAVEPWILSIRIPAWAGEEATLAHDGQTKKVKPGYARITKAFKPGETIELVLPMRARWVVPDPRIDDVRGQVAVERGPVVMCLESIDLDADVNVARVHTAEAPAEEAGVVTVPVSVTDIPGPSWPYSAHTPTVRPGQSRPSRLIPYYQWGNRGPSTMRVFIPVAE